MLLILGAICCSWKHTLWQLWWCLGAAHCCKNMMQVCALSICPRYRSALSRASLILTLIRVSQELPIFWCLFWGGTRAQHALPLMQRWSVSLASVYMEVAQFGGANPCQADIPQHFCSFQCQPNHPMLRTFRYFSSVLFTIHGYATNSWSLSVNITNFHRKEDKFSLWFWYVESYYKLA